MRNPIIRALFSAFPLCSSLTSYKAIYVYIYLYIEGEGEREREKTNPGDGRGPPSSKQGWWTEPRSDRREKTERKPGASKPITTSGGDGSVGGEATCGEERGRVERRFREVMVEEPGNEEATTCGEVQVVYSGREGKGFDKERDEMVQKQV